MPRPAVMALSETHVHLRARGAAEFVPRDFSKVTQNGATIVWDPGVDGILAGEGELSKSSEHAGERHLDGDEVLYLVSGAMRLSLELDEGGTTEIPLDQGQAVIVPQGVWHRLIIDAPIRLLYFGGGRTEIRSPV